MKIRYTLCALFVFVVLFNSVLVFSALASTEESTNLENSTLIDEVHNNKIAQREAIQEVDSGINPETFLHKSYNFYDVFSVACLVFVIISVIVYWIRHTLQQREDPLQQWLK